MEVIARYGTQAQKDQWLKPLLEGKIRSAFLMTEPDIGSSDAANIELEIRKEGNEYILNGQKWWSSGAGDERCKIYIVMGKSSPNNPDKYKQQSVILVPADTPGFTVHRMLSVYGYDDAPHGHGHVSFNNVRVPLDHMVLGEGRGFEIIQGRLGKSPSLYVVENPRANGQIVRSWTYPPRDAKHWRRRTCPRVYDCAN